MPKVNRCRHGLGQLVPELRTPGSDDGQQAHQLNAKEEAVQNPSATLNPALRRSRSAENHQIRSSTRRVGMMTVMIDMPATR